MKSKRLSKIVELVEQHQVYTQDDLLRLLEHEGITTTQATISRDIKELNLVKTVTEDGKYRYMLPREQKNDSLKKKFHSVFLEAVVSVDYAGHIVSVRCHTGMANAACAAMDTMKLEGIVGTLAGDDTFFILMRTEEQAQNICEQIRQMF